MNSRQLQYAVVLSQVLNISQAAEKLHITQPALSKQILSLEKELNVVLFDRSTTPLTLTRAGECFVAEATDILFREERLRRSMEDFKAGDKGRLTIGISPFRAGYFVSDTIRQLHQEFRGLQVVLKEAPNSTQLHREVADGLVDFAVINLPVDEAMLDVIPLEPEPVVLVVPNTLLEQVKNNRSDKVSLADCQHLPFIALGAHQELRRLFDKLCMTSGFVPDVTTEVVGIITAWCLAQAGIGATILPKRYIDGQQTDGKVSVFPLENAASVRRPAIVMRKGQHLSKYAKAAIELMTKR